MSRVFAALTTGRGSLAVGDAVRKWMGPLRTPFPVPLCALEVPVRSDSILPE